MALGYAGVDVGSDVGSDLVRDVALDDEFWAIVCADPDLVRLEFEQIVEGDPPQRPLAGGSPRRRSPLRSTDRPFVVGQARSRRPAGIERGPPPSLR